jgi:hypothetical protein
MTCWTWGLLTGARANTKDGGVALKADDVAARQLAIDLDDTAVGNSRGEVCARSDSDTLSAATTSSSITVANELINSSSTTATALSSLTTGRRGRLRSSSRSSRRVSSSGRGGNLNRLLNRSARSNS